MFGIDDWIIGTAATSLISGIGNAIEGSSQREDQERKIKRAQDQIRSSIIDEGELSLMLNNTERLFNNRLISTLNTTALKSRGYANAGVIGAAVAGSMEGEKLNSLQDIRFKVLQHNTTANNKIADLEMGMPTGSSLGDFATGFVGGIPTGIELSKLFKPDSIPTDLKPIDTNMSYHSSNGDNTMGKPFILDKYKYWNEEDELGQKRQLWNTFSLFN